MLIVMEERVSFMKYNVYKNKKTWKVYQQM